MSAVAGKPPEFVPLSASFVKVGRADDCALRLLHPTISRRHATLTRNGTGLVVEDHDSRFGTFVNGSQVRKGVAVPGDRIRFGPEITYTVEGDGLRHVTIAHGVSLKAQSLGVIRGGSLLLEGVSFEIPRNSFVGILGPSGAGKSTLSNCLAGYLTPDRGTLVFDERHNAVASSREYHAILGHVPQDDLIFPSLTVRENLRFAAQLRLGPDCDPVDVAAAVERAIEEVGIVNRADAVVGDLSGGQKKRVSVAVELLRRPRLLILDEPTSGLDPAREADLMELLRHIARCGTTVVCTTHLMDNLRLLDQVIVLGTQPSSSGSGRVGRLAFVGRPDDLLPTFACRHFADLYELLEQGRFSPVSSAAGESPAPVPVPAVPKSDDRTPRSSLSSSLRQSLRSLTLRTQDRDIPSQLICVTRRAFLQLYRDKGLVKASIAQPIALGLLNGLTQSAGVRLAPMLFFTVVIAIWLGLNNSVRDLVRERRLYVRDRLAGLHPGVYLASRWIVHSVVGAIQIVLVLIILKLTLLVLSPEALADEGKSLSFVWTFLVLMAAYTGALGLGLCVSALVRSQQTAVALLPVLIMPQLLISAVGIGETEAVFHSRRDDKPFRPLALSLRRQEPLSGQEMLIEAASLFCFSRPAMVLVHPRMTIAKDRSDWIRVADACHLLILVAGAWAAAIAVFHAREQRWIRLIDVESA